MATPGTEKTKAHTIADLNSLYLEGDSCDKEVFAEQRSNLLLVAGEHYNRRHSMFYRRIRDSREMNQEQKLRLTKNHIQNICKKYANNIVSASPGVGFEPKDDKSMQDQKAAELHHAVWQDASEKYGIQDSKIDHWVDDFIQVGELFVKIFFDPNQGEVVSFEQKLGEDGNPLFLDAQGQETPEAFGPDGSENQLAPDQDLPVFGGKFIFEDIYGFNLLRDPSAKVMDESPWVCSRKMVQKSDMKARYRGQDDKLKCFVESSDDTYIVFDGSRNGYKKSQGQVMIREYYFRAGPEYPRGYFYFTTKEGIFEQGELPGGIWPIVHESCERVQTTPRGRSPIKHMRPYQIEINRAASKIAEHQVTLGDDKLLIQNGTKISAGIALPGVRSINYTGAEPDILQGRSGEQYLEYMKSQIAELYMVMNVQEDAVEKQNQLDPYTLLYRSASQKKVFQRQTRRFERFLTNLCKTYLSLAKIHLPQDQIIYAVGKSEAINIAEFKNSTDICYQIKVEAQADDIETKLGQQLTMNHVLQYVGGQLKPEDIGKIMRQMPYANLDGSFDDMTIDYDSVENDLLALDRGENPPMNKYDNHPYCIKRLTLRQRKADYRYLPPQAQMAYDQRIVQHEELEAVRQQQIQMAEQGYIPTGGALLGCDFFVADPSSPSKTRRARLPSESIQWLVSHLESQGQGLDQLEGLNQGAQAEIAQKMAPQPGMGMHPPTPGSMHTGSAPAPSSVGHSSPYSPAQAAGPNGMGQFHGL